MTKLVAKEPVNVLAKKVQVSSEAEARARFAEVGSYVDYYRPSASTRPTALIDYEEEVYGGALVAGLMAGVGSMVFGSMLVLALSMGGLLSLAVILVSMYGNSGDKKNKFRNFLCNTLLSRKAKAKFWARKAEIDEFELASEMHRLLVSKARLQLEAEGVFELVNHDQQDRFIHVSDTGDFLNLSLSEYRKIDSVITDASEPLSVRIAKQLAS